MSFYERCILPYAIAWSMRCRHLTPERERWVPLAEGVVLEIGMGSGLNLPHYDRQKLTKLYGLEPSERLRRMAAKRARAVGLDIEPVGLSGEEIPLGRAEVDTVLSTWTLCTIPDARQALSEMRRVLKPGGRLVFVEHGRAPDEGVARWQDRLNGLQRRIGGGCNLNRQIDWLIAMSGFQMESLETGYLKGPRTHAYHYRGVARPA